MVDTGKQGGHHWLVSPSQVWPLTDLVLRFHHGLHLCVTAFDSGPIRPSEDEIAQGWTMQGNVMVSPPLNSTLSIPRDQYDEWYILARPAFAGAEIEVFVNCGGFTLVAPEETYKTFDPTWMRQGLDWLTPIQERFWSQLERLNPETYVAVGDNDVVVSRNRRFIQAVQDAA